eukprot:SM000035S13076  [mRNA]  locus=s35:366854:370553:+ [translate_table: standard]
MDGLFSKALDALEPLQSSALSALDLTLNEYPKPADVPPTPSGPPAAENGDGGGGGGGSGAAGFAPSALSAAQRVLQFWEELDLEGKKAGWDALGVAISQNQEASTKNRRTLADLTRAFKAAPEQRDVAPLLKSYQAEIDALTKRAKHAETAYLGVYQLLYDAPDAVPILRSFVDATGRVAVAEQEARRCRQELEVLRRDSANLKTLQATVRRLEERNAELEEDMEEKVGQIVLLREKELEKGLDAMREQERAQAMQLSETKESLAALQRLHDRTQSQLFDLRTQTEEERAAKQHELDLVTEEIDRAQERAVGLERVRSVMVSEMEQIRAAGQQVTAEEEDSAKQRTLRDLEENLSSKEKLISKLHQQMQQLEQALTEGRESNLVRIQELEEKVEVTEQANEALRLEISERPTGTQLEELRKQIRVLQALIGTDVDEEWDKMDEEDKEDNSEAARLRAALKDTNRKLMAELTMTRMSLSERVAELGEANGKIVVLQEESRALQQLIGQLEEDIVRQSGKGSDQSSQASWQPGPGAVSTLLQPQASFNHRSEVEAVDNAADGPSDDTMLSIVCGQRDRFRKRVKELEDQIGVLQESLARSGAEVEKLKNDNVSLYEKIKYLEQYNRQQNPGARRDVGDVTVFGGGGHSSARYACFSISNAGGMEHRPPYSALGEGGGNAEIQYRKLYEDRMNPFHEFHQREQDRSYKSLRLHDKITLTGGRFFLSNKYARTFLFFYTILLHLLIFYVIYKLAHPRVITIYESNPHVGVAQSTGGEDAAHTFTDVIAEGVGTLMQKTRDLTNQ